MRLFSYRDRPVHLGPYPCERLTRVDEAPDLGGVPWTPPLDFDRAGAHTLAPALARYQAMFDLVREGAVNPVPAQVSDDPAERARHLLAAGFYFDATLMGVCALPRSALRPQPLRNPRVAALGEELARS